MDNLSLEIWIPSHGFQVLEVKCNYEEKEIIRLYTPEETKNTIKVMKDTNNNYYVYNEHNFVEVFTQSGERITFNHEDDEGYVHLEVYDPVLGTIEALIENEDQSLLMDKFEISFDGTTIEIMNPLSTFEHEVLTERDYITSTISIKDLE